MQETMLSQNIIITERCQSLRQLGRNALRGKWVQAILAVLIYTLVMNVPVVVFDQIFGVNLANVFLNEGYTYDMDVELYASLYNSVPHVSILSLVWILLMSGPLILGLMIFFLAAFRGHNVVAKDVFLGFERPGKAVGLLVYQYLFIFLWSMLFIIPGIIATIRYSQAFYVLADDPSKTVRQCMNESKFMMKGNKMKYFVLSLSFIGWIALSVIPGSILVSIVDTMTTSEAAAAVCTVICALFMVPVYAYVYSTQAGFYEILAGHLIKETEPAPLSVDQIEVDAPIAKIEEVIEAVESQAAEEAEALADPEHGQMDPGQSLEYAPSQDPAQENQPAPYPEEQILPEPIEEEDTYHD